MAAISASNSLLPGTDLMQLDALAADSSASGYMKLYATNGSVYMNSQLLDVEVRSGGTIKVPTKKLSTVLKLAKSEYVTLACVGFELQVSSGNSLWRIQLPPKSEMPQMVEHEGRTLNIQTSEVLRLLAGVVRATADGMSRVSLAQVQVGNGYAISCDGARMHRVESEALEAVAPFTIPALGAKLFIAVLKGVESDSLTSLIVTDTSVTLHTNKEQITVLRSKVPFPEVEKVFISQSIMNDTTAIVSRTSLQEAIAQVKVFADEALSGVSITSSEKAAGKKALIIHAKDEVGNFSATDIEATITGRAVIDLKVNYKHLQDALASVTSELVTIRVAKSSKSKKTSAFIEDVEAGFVSVMGQLVRES